MKCSGDQLQVFRGKKTAIVGLGVEGLSSGRFLADYNAKLTFFDQKDESDLDKEVVQEAKHLGEVILGKDAFDKISGFDLVLRSPGIHKQADFLVKAQEEGAIITSQTKLFFDLCPCPIIGVTGTKGKGTTSTLIYEMLTKSGRDTYLGGNIGTPPLDFLNKLSEQSVVVLELSSFQLDDLTKSPHIAVMLMVVPEHLNYHKTAESYIDAKRNLLRFQTKEDFAVLNRDYIATNESNIYTDGQIFWVSRERPSTEQGCFIKDNAIWIRMQGHGSGRSAPEGVQGTEWKIIDTDKIALPGKHNWENACAAAMAATLAGATKSDIVEVLQSFTGLEHRLELVREVDGVKYYDDSFSTTPETAIAAIEAFSDPEILILGGSSKESDFSELGETIAKAKNIKAIIGIGVEWQRIKDGIHGLPEHVLLLEGAQDMHTVVQAASKIAREGDVVLLSPACASFDMFNNYKERGDLFKAEVNKL